MSLLLNKHRYWSRFETTILEIVDLAIDLFKAEHTFAVKEDDLNRQFYFCLVKANYQLQKRNKGLESPPFYEGNNQPSSDEEERVARESKRPDFQWSVTDISEPKPEKSSKQFVLECKRLGQPVGTWILNKNYVDHGVRRFIDENHGYGYGVEASAMLGYIQNMDIVDIIMEVNNEMELLNQPLIGNKVVKLNHIQFSHVLNKEFPLEKIELKHVWIDIR